MLTAAAERARRLLPLATRSQDLELLDRGCLQPAELEANLADLARLNRLPGGTSSSVSALDRLIGHQRKALVLDVGTGGADIPLALAARRGWHCVAVDAASDVLTVARRAAAAEPRVKVMPGDGRALPFADGTFDAAHCSLLLHHLDPQAAVTLLREMRRVSRLGVVVNDLRRGVIPLMATAVAVATLGRCRATRHDGLLSARRAYTPAELDSLLADAGLRPAWRSAGWLPRIATAATPVGRE